jgi:hypothetical protein
LHLKGPEIENSALMADRLTIGGPARSPANQFVYEQAGNPRFCIGSSE